MQTSYVSDVCRMAFPRGDCGSWSRSLKGTGCDDEGSLYMSSMRIEGSMLQSGRSGRRSGSWRNEAGRQWARLSRKKSKRRTVYESSRAGDIPETNKGESGGIDEVMYCTSGSLWRPVSPSHLSVSMNWGRARAADQSGGPGLHGWMDGLFPNLTSAMGVVVG